MSDEFKGLAEKLAGLAGKWTAYAAFGTFALYLLGYLTLRFQVSTYGLATDLGVFDDKYMFAGSRFLVYLVAAVPNVLLIVIVVGAILYVPWRLLPSSAKVSAARWFENWASSPGRLLFFGVVLAVVVIQLAMRKCFVLGNLLLAKSLPDHEWITSILRSGEGILSLYFSGLVAGLLLTSGLLLLAICSGSLTTILSRLLANLLIFLMAVQFLLLPVNYGILIASQDLPRVSELGGGETLPKNGQAWLVWESKDTFTYLVRENRDSRTLITIPRKDTKIKIVGYDAIFLVLFPRQPSAIVTAGQEDRHD